MNESNRAFYIALMTNINTTVCFGIFPSRLSWLSAKPLLSHGWGKQAVVWQLLGWMHKAIGKEKNSPSPPFTDWRAKGSHTELAQVVVSWQSSLVLSTSLKSQQGFKKKIKIPKVAACCKAGALPKTAVSLRDCNCKAGRGSSKQWDNPKTIGKDVFPKKSKVPASLKTQNRGC